MLEQVSTSVKFLAFFTSSKQGKTGLTVTIDIYDPSGTQIVTAGSATAVGGGLYSYTLSTNNSSEGEYAAIFKTSDSTVDAQHIPSLWVLGRAGVENLDAATSSRLASSGYTAPANSDISAIKAKTDNLPASPAATGDIPTADIAAIKAATDNLPSDPADQSLLDAAISGLSIPSVIQIRTEMDSNSTQLAGIKAKTDNLPSDPADQSLLEAAIAGVTAPSAATVASAVRSELSVELGRVDQAISSRLASADYTAPTSAPTAAAVASAVRTELTELSNLDASVSSRLASSAYTAPANNDISAIKAKTDNLPASPAATGDIPSANISAIKAKTDLLQTDRLAQCSTVATTGAQLAAALS